MKRIMIVGQPGAGKSTLARQLGQITGLPVHHIDLIHWLPGWIMRPDSERIAMANAVEAEDSWIFEGGLSVTWPNRLERADTLIVLDIPLWRRAWRVFRRTWRGYGQSRTDLPEDCPEKFDLEFWCYIWRTRRTARRKMLALIPQADDKQVWHVANSRDLTRLMRQVDQQAGG